MAGKRWQTAVVKTIPTAESGSRTTCTTKLGKKYLITNNPAKERFTLWRVVEDGYEKLSVSSNPLDFDKIIDYKS